MDKVIPKYFIVVILTLSMSSCINQSWEQIEGSSSLPDIKILSNPINNTIWAIPVGADYMIKISNGVVYPREYTSLTNTWANATICASAAGVYFIYGDREVKRYTPDTNLWISYPEFKEYGQSVLKCAVSDTFTDIVIWSSQWLSYDSGDGFHHLSKIPSDQEINSVFFDSNNEMRVFTTAGEILSYDGGWEKLYSPERDDQRIFLGITSGDTVWFISVSGQLFKLSLTPKASVEDDVLALDINRFGHAKKIIEVDGKIWLITSRAIITAELKPDIIVAPKQYGNILSVANIDNYVYMSTTEGIFKFNK